MKPTDPAFEPAITGLMSELSEHIREETDDLPALETYLGTGETEKLAERFHRTKLFVPTRYELSSPCGGRRQFLTNVLLIGPGAIRLPRTDLLPRLLLA